MTGTERIPELSFMLKSYGPDLPFAARLVDSFERYVQGEILLHVLVPDDDVADFDALSSPRVRVHAESLLLSHLVSEPFAGFSAGYMNQQIVKLAFWELGLCENYLCVDSDAVFVRPFSRADFMAEPGVPYTFLTEDAELRSEPEYFQEHWQSREPRLRRIQEAVGLDTDRLLTCHQHAVFSAAALRSFRDEFLRPQGFDYKDVLAISPYEFAWYNMWVQKREPIPLVIREPIFKTFHNASQHLEYLLAGVTEADVARSYVGLVVNSNYSRGAGVIGLDDSRSSSFASYLTVPQLLRASVHASVRRLSRRPAS